MERKYFWFTIIACGVIGSLSVIISRIYDDIFHISTQYMKGFIIETISFFIFYLALSLVLLWVFTISHKIFHRLPRPLKIVLMPPLEAIAAALICALIVFLITKMIFLLGLEHDPLAYIAVIYYGIFIFIGVLSCSFMNELLTISEKWIKSIGVLVCSMPMVFLLASRMWSRLNNGGIVYNLIVITVVVWVSKMMYVNRS